MVKSKKSIRDLDLTKDKIFSTTKLLLKHNYVHDFSIKVLLSQQKTDYKNRYGLECICCGSKIKYNNYTEDNFFELADRHYIENLSNEDIRELCDTCEYELSSKYSNIKDFLIAKNIVNDFHERNITINHSKTLKDFEYVEPKHTMVSEKDMYKEEREKYVTWARKNGVDIW